MPNQIHFENPRESRCALRRAKLSLFAFFFILFFCVAKDAVAAPVITSATTVRGTVGSAFSYQITATNASRSYGATGLPAGLTVNSGTGLISGTPTAAGSSAVTLSATNRYGTGKATLTLTIAVAAPSLTSLLPASAVARARAQTMTLNGTNFLSTSTVTYNRVGHAATFLNSTQLTISLSAADQAVVGAYPVVVTNPGPGGGVSNSVNFTVTGTVVSLSPSSLSFASQAVGATSAAQAITLNNTGNSALSITSVALTGTNASNFAQTNTCGSSVGAGTNCTISVTFKPTATGTRTAAVTLTDNATGSPQSVSLSGTTGGIGALASLSPSSLNFGNEPVSVISSSQVVTLTNTGSAALSIASIAFTGANAADFTQVNTCGASLAAGGSCTVAILFTPSAIGARGTSLVITDNASGSPQSISLSGTGVHDVVLTWTANGTSGVMGYNVYRGTTSGGESSTTLNSTPINGTTYTDTNVTAGASYYYVVKAVGLDGVTQSASSNQASAKVPSP